MPILGLPIGADAPGDQTQQMTRQMGHLHPAGNEKAGVVGQPLQVALARGAVPAEEGVANRIARRSRRRHPPVAPSVGRRAAPRRQADMPRALELQRQRPCDHILGPALRVAPGPTLAEFHVESRATPLGMFVQQPPDPSDVRAAQLSPLHHQDACHGEQDTAGPPGEYSKKRTFFCCVRRR